MDQCIYNSIAFSEAKKEKENITTPSFFWTIIFTHDLLRALHLLFGSFQMALTLRYDVAVLVPIVASWWQL